MYFKKMWKLKCIFKNFSCLKTAFNQMDDISWNTNENGGKTKDTG